MQSNFADLRGKICAGDQAEMHAVLEEVVHLLAKYEEKLVASAGEIQAAKAAQRRAELALTASDELAAMVFLTSS